MTTTNPATKIKATSKLDRAIIASMAAMTIFVLAQQMNSAPALAASGTVTAQQA